MQLISDDVRIRVRMYAARIRMYGFPVGISEGSRREPRAPGLFKLEERRHHLNVGEDRSQPTPS